MSHSLLKRSLQIVEGDLETVTAAKKSNPFAGKKNQNLTNKNSILDLIPENQRLTCYTKVGNNKKKQKINKIKTVEKFTVKQAQNKINRSKDKTEENVQKLLKLDSAFKLNDDTTELLIKRARSGHYVIPEQKRKDDEESVFTSEDFAKFEREYFCS